MPMTCSSGAGLCVSATSSLIVISPSAAAGLRRGVVGLHGLLDDPQLLGRHLHVRRSSSVVGRRPSRSSSSRIGGLQLGHHLDHVGRDVDRLHAVDQGALDRLLDPPARVRAEAAAVLRIEAFDGFEQADVSFLDQVRQLQAAVDVVLGDVDDQAQVRAHHALAGGGVVVVDDPAGELLLLVGREQRRLVDLPQVQLQARIGRRWIAIGVRA